MHKTNVVDAPPQKREPIEPHPESKSSILFCIDSRIEEDARVHHARPHHFDPSSTQFLRHVLAIHARIHFYTRFHERKETRAKTHLHVSSFEKLCVKPVERPLEMSHGNIFSHNETFELEKFCFVRHVGRLIAKDFSWHDYAIGRLNALFHLRFHVSDLDGGCLGAQNHSRLIFNKEGVLHVARRMILGDVEGVEVVFLALKEGSFFKRKSHLCENTVCLANERRYGMDVATRHRESISPTPRLPKPSILWYKNTSMFGVDIGTAITYIFLYTSLFFEVFLLVSFLERRRGSYAPATMGPQSTSRFPCVAIVVPCFNEARTLETTMRSLLALEYPRDKMEIVVVDDGSTDHTFSIAQSFTSDDRVRVFKKENGGKHTAMNLALHSTDAELIGCLDADSTVAPNALLALLPVFDNPLIAAVTPGIHVREPHTILQHMQNVEYRLSVFNRFIFAGLGSVFITPGPFSFFRASVVRALGGWRHGHATEDMEMALRMQNAGHLIANAPNAVVHTSAPATLRGLFHQRVRWTYGWLRNAVDYRFMLGNTRFGNLGLIILPSALISIAAGIYFFARILWLALLNLGHHIIRFDATGSVVPSPSFEPFYINTSAFLFLVTASVVMIVVLICIGSFIGTGSRRPPISTPLFLLFYSFLAPLWLCAAVVRATFKTGVRWR